MRTGGGYSVGTHEDRGCVQGTRTEHRLRAGAYNDRAQGVSTGQAHMGKGHRQVTRIGEAHLGTGQRDRAWVQGRAQGKAVGTGQTQVGTGHGDRVR